MATIVLGAAGAAIGGSIGGAILGVSAATIGGFIGSSIGSVVDSWIISSLAPTQRIEGARLDTLRITSATEGAVIPRLYGRMRMGGNIIWATDFREETKTTTQGGGKGGGGGKVKSTEYLYYASFAVALCEGPITGIGRIWADGKPMDLSGVTWRWYPGDEAQAADPFIAARMGAASTPAYRGTAYVVFEELALGLRPANGDLQGFHTCFMAKLQAVEARINQAPASFAVLAILNQDVSKGFLQRVGHPLRCPMRHLELPRDLLEADPTASCGSQLCEPDQVLSLGKGHVRLAACQFLTPPEARKVVASCRADSLKCSKVKGSGARQAHRCEGDERRHAWGAAQYGCPDSQISIASLTVIDTHRDDLRSCNQETFSAVRVALIDD